MTTLSEYQAELSHVPADDAVLAALAADSRVGAQRLLDQYHRRVDKLREQRLELRYRSRFEHELWPTIHSLPASTRWDVDHWPVRW